MSKDKKKALPKGDGQDGNMPLRGHLKELRNRIIVCIVVFLAVCVIALGVAQPIIDMLRAVGERFNYEFVFIKPQELMMQQFKVSLLAGAVVTFPLILYELWAFMRPGLKKRESNYFLFGIVFGLLCFVVGVIFAYYVTLPGMLFFFQSISTEGITAQVSIEYYIDFVLLVFVIFGVVFEIPMVSVILTQVGILNPDLMKKGRGIAIVLIFLIAAFITPTDIFSQFIVALPMCALYQLSIFLSAFFYRRRKAKLAAEGLDEEDEDEEDEDDEDEDDE